MKRLLVTVCIGALLGWLLVVAAPAPAGCSFCASFTCYSSSMCGRGCVCLKRGGEMGGSCYSVD